MSEPVKFAQGSWNPFASLSKGIGNATSNMRSNSGIEGSHGALSGKHLKGALQLNEQHHGHVMDHLRTSYDLETKFQTHLAGLTEQAAQGTHSRALELHNAIQKSAGDNTAINISFPEGGNVSYTRRPRKSPSISPQVSDAVEESTPRSQGWTSAPEGAKSLPITSKPAATEQVAEEKGGPSVGRDPKTGRAISIKGSASKPSKPAKSTKKSSIKITGAASVKRDPKTGRAVSLKK